MTAPAAERAWDWGAVRTPAAPPPTPRGRAATFARGPAGDPVWARPALLVLLAGTAVLYLWGLGASGNANDFYAAAVQAGTKSWKALFFGSLDAGNYITVDKPPASLWVMSISGRIFGFGSWSMLVPQALEGVAAVGVLYAAVRRVSGHAAGLAAGAMLALTPVTVLMFRFNNPDALLVLLMVVAAYCVVRALEEARTRWVVLAGVAIGFAFLTKMLQGFLVLPAFGAVYLLAAPTGWWRRVWQLLAGGLAIVLSAGWWVAATALWPKDARPYIGGSTDNSVLGLAFGYNGLGRIFGGDGNRGGGGGGPGGGGGFGGGAFGGQTGWSRLFSDQIGSQWSWLVPGALILLVGGLWTTRRAPRTDRTRASLILWGGWLIVTGIVFSFMEGTFHPYYTVALTPALGGLAAVGGREMWRTRDSVVSRIVLAVSVVATGLWAYELLKRVPDWYSSLRVVVLVIAVVAAVALVVGRRVMAYVGAGVSVAAAFAVIAAPGAYALDTASTAHTGSIPSAGPGGGGGFGGGFGGGRGTADTALIALLRVDASSYRWVAATESSMTASPIELGSGGLPVMALGGFTGSDPAITLAQFQSYVDRKMIHYYVGGGGFGRPGGGGQGISTWVQAHYTAVTVGGSTVYDLTRPTS